MPERRDPSVHDLTGRSVLVTGARVAGLAAARALQALGARVTVSDGNPQLREAAAGLGVEVAGDGPDLPAGTTLVVTSPGYRPEHPLLTAAATAGVPVWGDVELAWRCDTAEVFGPRRRWLAVTGTNGKTTTTTMLESVLRADGRAALACGNVGLSVLDALRDPSAATDLAVELSSFQLHWAPSVRPTAGAVLNLAEDHLDWHGGMAAYAAAKARVLTGGVAVLGLDDAAASALRPTAARTVGFRLGDPGAGEVGYRDDVLVDRAFADDGDREGTVLAAAAEIHPGGRPGLLDAAAAAALARAVGVAAGAVGAGLRAHEPGAHRSAHVVTVAGVDYVDDSKATNPHAALASVSTHPRVVWIAGGLLKGAAVDELVVAVASRLVGVVLLGRDRAVLAAALARHAPDVPVVEVASGDDARVVDGTVGGVVDEAGRVMGEVVRAAAGMARAGDTVLLAPAAASMDVFTDYAHRGRAFAGAARALGPA